ncbi:MAG: putative LacI-family transcriptional regulator [Chloroflexi bacterium]|nr:putative LacI-family transcriptional regulator [Chloroflexota bacterium]
MTKRQRANSAPTIHDVAAAAGVSRATAARALGGYGPVSDDARARVMSAADRLGYRPNRLARSMITGTTHTLGVVIADIQLAFFAQAVRGISDAARAQEFEVILANTDEDRAKELAAVDVLIDKRVDGLIVAPADSAQTAHLAEAQRRGIPVVLIDRGAPGLRCDVVAVDNQRAARNAVNHLIRLGHRRIAIVTEASTALSAAEIGRAHLPPAGQMTSVLRQAGWAAALRGAGLPVTDELIRTARYDRDDARAATAAAIAGADRPTAILTTDETMTLGALEAILEAGLDIPGDISLVGFDDSPWTTVVRPPLTVIAQPVYELGAMAARRLLARVAGDDSPPGPVFLDTSFILRGSTGRAPEG